MALRTKDLWASDSLDDDLDLLRPAAKPRVVRTDPMRSAPELGPQPEVGVGAATQEQSGADEAPANAGPNRPSAPSATAGEGAAASQPEGAKPAPDKRPARAARTADAAASRGAGRATAPGAVGDLSARRETPAARDVRSLPMPVAPAVAKRHLMVQLDAELVTRVREQFSGEDQPTSAELVEVVLRDHRDEVLARTHRGLARHRHGAAQWGTRLPMDVFDELTEIRREAGGASQRAVIEAVLRVALERL